MTKVNEVESILRKIGLSYDDARTVIEHFAKEYLKEKCELSYSLEISSGYEADYVHVSSNICIYDKSTEEPLISETVSDSCYIGR